MGEQHPRHRQIDGGIARGQIAEIGSHEELMAKHQQGRMEFVPFASAIQGHASWSTQVLHVLLWLPIGLLVGGAVGRPRPRLGPIVGALTAVVALSIVRLFVYTRYSSTSDVITGWCGVAVGAMPGLARRRN